MPKMVPRASSYQYGAYRPLKAVTKTQPPLSGTVSASALILLLDGMNFQLSTRNFTLDPPTAMLPSNAYIRLSGPKSNATVVSRPCVESAGWLPMLQSRKQPVPYVFLAAPGVKAFWPTKAADWSPKQPVMATPWREVLANVP